MNLIRRCWSNENRWRHLLLVTFAGSLAPGGKKVRYSEKEGRENNTVKMRRYFTWINMNSEAAYCGRECIAVYGERMLR